jgi:probable phosphoglycerate mutase
VVRLGPAHRHDRGPADGLGRVPGRGPGRPPSDLAEWAYGAYEGKTSAEIIQGRPGWNIFQDGCPNGEAPEQVAARADRLLDRLRPLPGLTALFSHGHFGRALGARWMGLPLLAGARLLLDPASLSFLGYEHDKPDAPVIGPWNQRPGPLT